LFGYIFKDAYAGLGSDFFGGNLPTYNETYRTIEADFLLFKNKFIPVFFSVLAALSAVIVN